MFGKSLQGVIPVLAAAVDGAIRRVASGNFAADETTPATVATCHASVRYLLAISREHGLDLGVLRGIDRVFQRTVDGGHADADFAAVYQALRAE